jgi:hypothetical protein
LMGWVVGSTHKSQVFCLPFFVVRSGAILHS